MVAFKQHLWQADRKVFLSASVRKAANLSYLNQPFCGSTLGLIAA